MDNPVAVRVIERTGDLDRADQRLFERQSPGRQSLGQRVAFEVLHDEEVDLVMAPDVVERADVRVRERGDCPRFAGEAGAHLFIACVTCGQDFDRHRAIETGIDRPKDFSHAAGTESAFDPVGAEGDTRADLEAIVQQRCGGCPERSIQEDTRYVLTKQRLHLASQVLVARTRLVEERLTHRLIPIDG